MSISCPDQTPACRLRAVGAPVPEIAVQVLPAGSYFAPSLKGFEASSLPPQTIIRLSVQTAVWSHRASRTPVEAVIGDHCPSESAAGLKIPPVSVTKYSGRS